MYTSNNANLCRCPGHAHCFADRVGLFSAAGLPHMVFAVLPGSDMFFPVHFVPSGERYSEARSPGQHLTAH